MNIRKRITVTFILILFFSLLITCLISYFVVRTIIVQSALSNLHSISQAEFNLLESIIEQNRERLDLVRSRTQMRINLKNYNQTHKKKYQDGMNRILDDALISIPDFKEISIIDSEGIVVSSTNRENIGMEYANEYCFIYGKNEDVLNVFSLDEDLDLNIYLCGPLSFENERIGILVITASGDKITHVVTDYTLLGETGYALLIFKNSQTDRYIVSIRRRKGEPAHYSYVDFDAVGHITQKTILKETGIYRNINDYKNRPMYAVVNYNENLDISLSVRMSREEVLKPLVIYRNVLICIFILSLIIMFIFTFINAKTIMKPVIELTHLAEGVSEGDLNQRIEVESKGEIGILSRTFNMMAENLKKDMERRKQMEKSLRESEERFRSTLDNMMEGAQILDHELQYVYINDAAEIHNQRPREELIGKKYVDVWPGIEKTKVFKVIKQCLEKRESLRFENEFEFPTGDIGWFELGIQSIPEGVFILSIDITERKKVERELQKHHHHLEYIVKKRTEELQSANKELEAFAYSVSHDLRAPLRAIDGFTGILMEDYSDNFDDEGKRLGAIIRKNSKKMGQLIDDLLAFSRLGRVSMHISSIDMENMVNAIYHEATPPNERKRIKFTVDNIPNANGDPNMFRQVWMNLISNAIKFSSYREKAIISVSSYENKNDIVYMIKDNGAGFDMHYKDKLFGVFQRLHAEREFSGTGVGLALVQRIIHRHEGKIWAEGEVDKGATFYFSLPKKGKE